MKKVVFLLMSIMLVITSVSVSFATEEDMAQYYYTNDSGELVGSNEYELDKDAVLLENPNDLESLYGDYDSGDDVRCRQESDRSGTLPHFPAGWPACGSF
jgi:hypothetical protein